MAGIAAVFDEADEVRIVGPGTDLTLSLAGRHGAVDDGHVNMPGGEVFYSPVEDSAEGVVEFREFPAVYYGHEVVGVRLAFEQGRIVDASASSGEEFLLRTLDTDDGARRLGELGIGCNPGIQRFMKNVAFDEKIDGTVHLARRQLLLVHRREERERDPLGHRQGPAHRRVHLRGRPARPARRPLGALGASRGGSDLAREAGVADDQVAVRAQRAAARSRGGGRRGRTASRPARGSPWADASASARSISGSTSSRLSSGGRPTRRPPPESCQCACGDARDLLGRLDARRRRPGRRSPSRRAAGGPCESRARERRSSRATRRSPARRAATSHPTRRRRSASRRSPSGRRRRRVGSASRDGRRRGRRSP